MLACVHVITDITGMVALANFNLGIVNGKDHSSFAVKLIYLGGKPCGASFGGGICPIVKRV